MDESPKAVSNACAGLEEPDRARLAEAARAIVAARGILMRIVEFVGSGLNQVGGPAASLARKALGERGGRRLSRPARTLLRPAHHHRHDHALARRDRAGAWRGYRVGRLPARLPR